MYGHFLRFRKTAQVTSVLGCVVIAHIVAAATAVPVTNRVGTRACFGAAVIHDFLRNIRRIKLRIFTRFVFLDFRVAPEGFAVIFVVLLAAGKKSDRSHHKMIVKHPVTGNEVTIQVTSHTNDTFTQALNETWRFTEMDKSGKILRREVEHLRMRWTFRWEMRYLFELTGFVVEEELSDFKGSPASYGREQVWIARKT